MAETEERQIRELKNQYIREWRKRNPERAAEIQRRYWRKKLFQQQQNAAGGDSEQINHD